MQTDSQNTTATSRALIIESDPLYACIIGEMLKEGSRSSIKVTLTHQMSEATVALRAGRHDVILADLSLADVLPENPTAVLEVLQQVAPNIPVIVLTSVDNEDTAVQILQAGAQDYLVKGQFRVQGLMRAIRYARERQRLRLALQASLEKEIASGEERFQRIIATSADGVIILDENQIVQFVNPGAEALLEQAAPDLLGTPFFMDVQAGDITELKVPTANGHFRISELRVVATQWQQAPALLISMRDISAHKQAEADLRQYTSDLHHRNEDLDAFSHTVAHDLKNPAGLIVGFSEAILDDIETFSPDDLRHYLKLISRNGRKIDDIINELLMLASVRQEDVEPQPLNMAAVLAEVQERLAFLIKDYGAELLLPDKWPVALGHAPWIEEVWANYISNAIKYGGEPPRVELGATLRPNQTVTFWVSDNGKGLSDEEKERLFMPFTQLKKVRAKGSGLGLSIVRRIITRLDGEVGVRSEPGTGSTFFFTLPAVRERFPVRQTS
jgi:signal transduction histidine kinase